MRGALLVLTLAACGRFGFGDDDASSDAPSAQPRAVAPVAGLTALAVTPVDLGVTGTPSGFTLTWAIPPGSNMFGVKLDRAMTPDRDWRVTSSRTDYVATTDVWTGSAMTTMTIDPPYTYIKRYVDDLSSYAETDGANGAATRPGYVNAGGRWFWAVVDASMLHIKEMASDGTGIGNVLDVPDGGTSGTVRSGAFVALDGELAVVWSHAAGVCEWGRIATSPLAAQHAPIGATCYRPRLASEQGLAVAVFDNGMALQLMTMTAAGADAVTPLAAGTNVRLLRDPSVGYWLAWLDGSSIALATLVPGATLVRVPLAGIPNGSIDGYELVLVDGRPYLFVVAAGRVWWSALDTPGG